MEPCLFRHGKARNVKAVMALLDASMEPCLFRHGKIAVYFLSPTTQTASMEPCLFRHGKHLDRPVVPEVLQASMEPCLFRHGKTSATVSEARDILRLQWSHVFSDMVSATPAPMAGGGSSFNGAMSFQTW